MRKGRVRKGKMVLVNWVDSDVLHGWFAEDIRNEMAQCRSVGILLSKNKETVDLAMGDSNRGLVLEKLSIPQGCVVSIHELEIKLSRYPNFDKEGNDENKKW